jgi:hypothetical protein
VIKAGLVSLKSSIAILHSAVIDAAAMHLFLDKAKGIAAAEIEPAAKLNT